MQVMLDSLFARQGSAPIWGGKKREFRDWTKIDHIAIARKCRKGLMDVRIKRGVEADSDHHFLLGTYRVKPMTHRDSSSRPHCK